MNKTGIRWHKELLLLLPLVLAAAVMFKGFVPSREPAPCLRDNAASFFHEQGVQDTGAINLVSAIYLGYRAFDTLCETIVLLLAVSGVLFLIKEAVP